jgi:threonine dehydratase
MPEPVSAITKRLPDLAAIEAAVDIIRPVVPPTPQILWPLLSQRAGAEVWVKHENHTLTGAFKIRGGLICMHELKHREPTVTGVVAATRGNHGQSVAVAARLAGLRAVIHVPHGNDQTVQTSQKLVSGAGCCRGCSWLPLGFLPGFWLFYVAAVGCDGG